MKRKLHLFLVLLLTLPLLPITGQHKVQAETGNVARQGLESLIPTPQSVDKGSEIFTIGDRVNLVLDTPVDTEVEETLNDILEKENIVVNDVINNEDFTIYLSLENGVDEEIAAIVTEQGLEDIQSKGNESYQLVTYKNNLIINASDARGLFYGVKTFGQLIVDKSVEAVDIVDYPTMTVRGTVEGFYGTPWTTEERIDQFEFYGNMKMNTYIYAPKDDPYHRRNWREPYPAEQMDRMLTLIEEAHRNKVDFVFAISPGIDIDLSGEAKEKDFNDLMNKMEAMYEMGVRSFAIYLDDISNKDGVNQAKLLNRFQEEFIEKYDDVEPLITVPTEYDTFAMIGNGPISTYTKDFSETINDDIHVMWTGSVVVSEELTTENAEFVHNIYGDNIAVWWNYPVTDYQKEKLALGPIVDIDKDIDQYVDYFLMNPMEHAHLSKIALGTGADFSWNTQSYDEDDSWLRILDYLYDDLAGEMKIFSEHSSRMNLAWDVGRLEAPEMKEDILDYWISVGAGENIDQTSAVLKNGFDEMVAASEKLLAELPDEILAEGKENIKKLGLLGRTANKALAMNLAENAGDTERYNQLKLEVENSRYNYGKQLSEKVTVEFIDEALNFNPLPAVDFDLSSNFVEVNEEIQVTNKSSLVTSNIRWEFPGATILNDSKEDPVISYPAEGRYTVKLFGENSKGKDELIKVDFITVSEIAKETPKNLALNKKTEVSSTCAPNEAGRFAVDGNLDSKWCANVGREHYIIIDLGQPSLLTSINIHHAEAGGEPKASNTRDYTLEVSQDGREFETIADVSDNTKGVTTDHFNAQEARYVKLNITRPTQGVDRAARIFEIEVKGYEGSYDLPPSYTDLESMKQAAVLVDRQIYRLPNARELTKDETQLVESVRLAYENLSDTAKAHVRYLRNLELREERLDILNAVEEVADKFAVRELQRRIYRLPSARVLTVEDAPQVEGIRTDYEKLNDASKEIFSPQYLKNLEIREAKLKLLE